MNSAFTLYYHRQNKSLFNYLGKISFISIYLKNNAKNFSNHFKKARTRIVTFVSSHCVYNLHINGFVLSCTVKTHF